MFVIPLANLCETAFVAVGFACLAHVAAVEDEPVMGDGDFLLGYVLHQFALGLQGVLAVAGKADAVGHTEHMGVHGQGGEIEYHRGDDVGGLASYTGQGMEWM